MGNPAWDCTACPLSETRTQVVWGTGSNRSGILIQGEAPGREEDISGEPFVGKSGKLLNILLGKAGLSRADLYITNTVKCRPPENRRPLPREEEACSDWLELEARVLRPKVVLLMGGTAARARFPGFGIVPTGTARAGDYFGAPTIYLCTYHPSAALREFGFHTPFEEVAAGRIARIILRDIRRAKRYAHAELQSAG